MTTAGDPSVGTELRFGAHRLAFEEPDTVHIELCGELGDELQSLVEALEAWSVGRPYILTLASVSRVTTWTAGARKVALSSHQIRLPPRALALYGGGFALRMSVEMLMRATAVLGARDRYFFHGHDEAEARAWLTDMRPKLAGAARA
ncbi:hypothetical protein [Polyangium jinanense]|uniref:STAS/SEC14 domain-containing protein n=1 Tax=Polyangium jinanense TaxID=2829994 RepID=A0A9X3X4W8_9BACT|nr:hypothetical protein [Polyangium jinanense]MDC3955676.1 hypothetical protein [Polyangium jinanense]MDC3982318.1 hypothetical protein [Polyangium jinanense]